jgi:uncharacterized protein with FMN-binding domain
MQSKRRIHPALAALIIIVLLGIVTSVVIVVNNQDSNNPTNSSSQNSETPTGNSQTPSTNTSTYKDGTYQATASYVTPGGIETINVSIVIKDGVISDSQVSASGNTDHAKEHQAEFESGYKTLVVGKSVDEVHLSRISGSSLTSSGFNAALDEIKQDAKA